MISQKKVRHLITLFSSLFLTYLTHLGSYEFANMKATSNTETELASGREPNEMSRPTTSTRSGFSKLTLGLPQKGLY